MITRTRRTATLVLALFTAGCISDIVEPSRGIEYALESIDGAPLPVTLLTDYDITVSVVSDVIRLRADSTFIEVARFRGVSADSSLVATDSITGTYTVSGNVITFLTRSAAASRLTIDNDGDALTQTAGRRFVYRRVMYL